MPRLVKVYNTLLAAVGAMDIDDMRRQRDGIGESHRVQHVVAGQAVNAHNVPPFAHSRVCGGR